MGGFWRFIFWDYPRGSRQYDIIVGVIVLFVLFTPRSWYRDQPKASSVVLIGSEQFWIEPGLLSGFSQPEWPAKADFLLKSRHVSGPKQKVVRVEPIFDSEQEIRGYMAFTAAQ